MVRRVRRLHDNQLDLLDALERPPRRVRSHSCGGVEHRLRVLLHIDRHARTKLPVQHDGAATDATDQIGRAKDAGQRITKTHDGLDLKLHLPVRVHLIQRPQRRDQLLGVQLLRQRDALVGRADVRRRGRALPEHVRDGVVQQRALVGVLRRRLERHLLDEGDGAGAGDDALGCRAADDVRVLSHYLPPHNCVQTVWRIYARGDNAGQDALLSSEAKHRQ